MFVMFADHCGQDVSIKYPALAAEPESFQGFLRNSLAVVVGNHLGTWHL